MTNYSSLNSHDLISIIVPVFNMEQYIQACLDSILNQTYTNFEVLCINDGSTDSSLDILDSYQKKDSRIQVISQENGGLSSARNIGLNQARGEYITFVDADDFIANNYLQALYTSLKKTQSKIAVCAYQEVQEDRKPFIESISNIFESMVSTSTIFEHMFDTEYIPFITSWSSLYHRSIWDSLRFPLGKVHEDEFVFHKVYSQVNQVVYLDAPLYYYRIRRNSLVHKEGQFQMHSDKIVAIYQRFQYFEEHHIPILWNHRRVFLYLMIECYCTYHVFKYPSIYVQEYKKISKKNLSLKENMFFLKFYIRIKFHLISMIQ